MTRRSVQDGQIRAHVRRTMTPGGEIVPIAFVRCPRENRMIELSECATCGHCARLFVDEGTLAPILSCDSPPAGGSQASGPSDGPLVCELSSGDVLCFHPGVDLRTCASLFRESLLRWAPVIDDRGAPLGAVSRRDLLDEVRRARALSRQHAPGNRRAHVDELLSRRRVADIMRPSAPTIPDGAPARLVEPRPDDLIVVDDLGRVIGALSTRRESNR